MVTKVNGTTGITFPDTSVQATAADAGLPAFDVEFSSTHIPTGLSTPTLFPLVPVINLNTAIVGNRFTPNIAGYYWVSVYVSYSSNGILASNFSAIITKNGVVTKIYANGSASTIYPGVGGSGLIYMNGTTDYLEFGTTHNAAGVVYGAIGTSSGFLVRRAV